MRPKFFSGTWRETLCMIEFSKICLKQTFFRKTAKFVVCFCFTMYTKKTIEIEDGMKPPKSLVSYIHSHLNQIQHKVMFNIANMKPKVHNNSLSKKPPSKSTMNPKAKIPVFDTHTGLPASPSSLLTEPDYPQKLQNLKVLIFQT